MRIMQKETFLMNNKTVTMAHGAGGKQTSELIDEVFKAHFANPDLTADDAAVLVPPTGKMAAAAAGGIAKSGSAATIKHFAANSQEKSRFKVDAVVSERAMREIYLKAFEMAVREGGATSVMTSSESSFTAQ